MHTDYRQQLKDEARKDREARVAANLGQAEYTKWLSRQDSDTRMKHYLQPLDVKRKVKKTVIRGAVAAWGISKTVTQWAKDDRCKVGESALRARLKAGWAPREAISRPNMRQRDFWSNDASR